VSFSELKTTQLDARRACGPLAVARFRPLAPLAAPGPTRPGAFCFAASALSKAAKGGRIEGLHHRPEANQATRVA